MRRLSSDDAALTTRPAPSPPLWKWFLVSVAAGVTIHVVISMFSKKETPGVAPQG